MIQFRGVSNQVNHIKLNWPRQSVLISCSVSPRYQTWNILRLLTAEDDGIHYVSPWHSISLQESDQGEWQSVAPTSRHPWRVCTLPRRDQSWCHLTIKLQVDNWTINNRITLYFISMGKHDHELYFEKHHECPQFDDPWEDFLDVKHKTKKWSSPQ